MTNFTSTAASGTGNVNLLNCDISGTLTKSGTSLYTFIRLTDLGAASITGSGLVDIYGGNTTAVTVNNASAVVLIKNGTTVAPVLTAGNLSLVQTVVVAAVTNAVTSAAGSVITIANSQLVNTALTGVAPVVLNGFYSIVNTVFDKPNSTLVALSGTGGTTNSIDYFQYINADKFITQGGTSSQYVKGDGSLDSSGPTPLPTTYSPVFSSSGGTSQIAFTGTPATGSYMKQGKLVHFRIKVLYTTLTSFGGGAGLQYFVTLPFAPAADYVFRDALYVKGSNGNQYELSAHGTAASTTLSLWHSAGSGNEIVMSHSAPVNALVADYFYLSGTYESV
jgi:hypothetical protein